MKEKLKKNRPFKLFLGLLILATFIFVVFEVFFANRIIPQKLSFKESDFENGHVAQETKDGVGFTMLFDKKEYPLNERIKAKAIVKNTSNKTLSYSAAGGCEMYLDTYFGRHVTEFFDVVQYGIGDEGHKENKAISNICGAMTLDYYIEPNEQFVQNFILLPKKLFPAKNDYKNKYFDIHVGFNGGSTAELFLPIKNK